MLPPRCPHFTRTSPSFPCMVFGFQMDSLHKRRSSNEGESRSPLRTILPAASPRHDIQQPQPKRARVSLACAACRSRKTKCDGGRPKCNECTSRSSACQYTETESTQVKRKHADLEELFDLLRMLPEEEALGLFHKIRAGIEPQEVMEQARHGTTLVQLAGASKTASPAESGETSSTPVEGEKVSSRSLQVILQGGKQGAQE